MRRQKSQLGDKEKATLSVAYRDLMAQEKAVHEQKAKIKEEFPDVGRAIFEEDVKALFDQNPELHSFKWEQYTDFFNDGEPCTFGVHRWDWCVNDSISEYDDEDEFEKNPEMPELSEERLNQLEKVVHAFMDSFTDDDLEDMFGDHVRVHVRRDGVTTEDYDTHG